MKFFSKEDIIGDLATVFMALFIGITLIPLVHPDSTSLTSNTQVENQCWTEPDGDRYCGDPRLAPATAINFTFEKDTRP